MNFFKKFTIRKQLIINALLTIAIVITIFLIAYMKISKILIDKNTNYTSEITSNIQRNTATYYQEIKSILQNIGYDANTQKIFSSNDYIDSYTAGEELNILTINMVNIKKDIFDIAIVGENGKYYTMNGHYETVKELMKTVPDDGKIYNTGFEKLEGNDGSVRMFFLYGMHFFSAYNSDSYAKKLGYTAILVDLKPLFIAMQRVASDTEIKYYLMDKNGNMYSPGDPLNINNNMDIIKKLSSISVTNTPTQSVIEINGAKNIVMISDIPEIEGRIVSFVSEKELFLEIEKTREEILKYFLIALIFILLLFLLTISNITSPIKKLISFMNELKSGSIRDLKKTVQLEGSSEINILGYEFNSMMAEVNNLTRRLFDTSSKLYEVEIEKKKAELAFLRSQINPHFLYNTLEVMKGISLEEGVDKLYEMTKALALIFRYSVNGSSVVTLYEELEIIRAYIQIHIIRFGDRLIADFSISNNTNEIKVFKMILQPIVENAIFHGLEPKRGKGTLRIGSKIEEGKLVIWVKDDGVGIQKENLNRIKESLLDNTHLSSGYERNDSKVDSIGIHNINNRIKLTYGAEYGLSIDSEKDTGTEVVLIIPTGEI